MKNEVTKKIQIPAVDQIFYAGTGFLLLRTPEGLTLYDVQQKRLVVNILIRFKPFSRFQILINIQESLRCRHIKTKFR